MSSLIDLEFEQGRQAKDTLDTESFGKLWLEYQNEHQWYRQTFDTVEIAASILSREIGFYIVEIIGNEFIAASPEHPLVLIHAVVTDESTLLTARAAAAETLRRFIRSLSYQ